MSIHSFVHTICGIATVRSQWLSTVVLLAAAWSHAPASAQSLLKQHQLTSAISFCCSGAFGSYSSPWVDTDGSLYTPVGYSWAGIQSTVAPGSFGGSISLQAYTEYGVHVKALGGQIWNWSSDILYASSSSLPAGTPVTLRFELRIDGDWGAEGRSLMNVAGLAQVESSAGYPGEHVVFTDRSVLTVGGSWAFDTQYRAWGDGFFFTNDVKDGVGWNKFVNGHASLTIKALSADVQLSSASGHNYALLPVPEPSAMALMLAGLAVVGGIARRRGRFLNDRE